MHTTVAFAESVDAGGSYTELAAVSDDHVNTQGDNVTVSSYNQIIGAAAFTDMTVANQPRLNSPSLRRMNPYHIMPQTTGLAPSAANQVYFHPDSPIPLVTNEFLNAQTNSNPGVAAVDVIVAFLAEGPIQPVSGEIYTVRATVTITPVANQWTGATIDIVDELPVGDYDVVGADLIGATIAAFRFNPVGSATRPGALARATGLIDNNWFQRRGGLGVWFTFNTVQLPQLQVLSFSAPGATTYQVFLDVIPR